jgi:hypothetical protein
MCKSATSYVRRNRLAASGGPFVALAAVSLSAAVVAAAVEAIGQFDHGVWLVAYLFLVGFLAQLLLGHGRLVLGAEPSLPARIPAPLVLWNIGVFAVPAGVLADSRLLVVLGSAALLGALAQFRRSVRPACGDPVHPTWLRPGYTALIAFMGASVVAGIALAWDTPWL